jgi:CheY-like chemotaxis protein/transcriptional regulator with GAF, ATPase, and Fis domain
MQVLIEFAFCLVLFFLWLHLDRLRAKSIKLELKGWTELLWGVFFIFAGSIVDVSENIPYLNKFLIINNTNFSAIIKVGLYILGIILVLISPLNWLRVLLERKMKDEDKKRREKFLLAVMSELKDKTSLSDIFNTVFPEIIGFVKAQKGAAFLISEGKLVLSGSSGFSNESVEALKIFRIEDDPISWCAKNNSSRIVNSFSESERRLTELIADDQARSLICSPLSSTRKNLGVLAIFSKTEFKKEDLLVLTSLSKEIGELIQYLNYESELNIRSEKLKSVEEQRGLLLDLCGVFSELKTEKILNQIVEAGVKIIHSDSCKIFETDSENEKATIIASTLPDSLNEKVEFSEFPEIKEVMGKREIVFKTVEVAEPGIKSFLALPLFFQDKTLGVLLFEFREYSPASTEVEIDLAKSLANLVSFILFHQRLSEAKEKELLVSFEFLNHLNNDLFKISEKSQLLLREMQSFHKDPRLFSEELKSIDKTVTQLSETISTKMKEYPEVEEKIQKEKKEEVTPKEFRVLAIDDQEAMREILKDMSQSLGYQIELAADGEEGLKTFERDNFDLVITELDMPEISGWDVSREVKRMKSDVLVVLLTELTMPAGEKMLKDYGVDFVLTKPFKLDQLSHIIKKAKEVKEVENP